MILSKFLIATVSHVPRDNVVMGRLCRAKLIRGSIFLFRIIEQFCPRFTPGAEILYVGDTKEKLSFCDTKRMKELGCKIDEHGKMPDVIVFYPEKKWLVLVESVTSHGPVDAKRHAELARLFSSVKLGLVYVTAFPDRSLMARYLGVILWETEVWVADAPDHLIHFNGDRFLGPYK